MMLSTATAKSGLPPCTQSELQALKMVVVSFFFGHKGMLSPTSRFFSSGIQECVLSGLKVSAMMYIMSAQTKVC